MLLASRITLAEAIQLTLGGVFNGGLYAVAAIGLALVFGVMGIINVAHGHFIVLGSYVAFWAFLLWGVDPFLSIVITVPALFAVGAFLEKSTIEPVVGFGPDEPLLITFALILIIESLLRLFWTANVRGLTTEYSGLSLQTGYVSIPVVRLLVFLVATASVASLDIFLTKTHVGKALRATAQDRMMAESVGVDTKRAYQVAFALGTAYAGLAGSLIAVSYAFEPSSGLPYLSKAFAVVVLAGLGNVRALVVAGIMLGLVEVFGGFIFGGGVKDALSYLIFLLVLLLKPAGLAGKTQK
jgi:branched-chain amino acid transport system permease protein